jgi:hypothetical protein
MSFPVPTTTYSASDNPEWSMAMEKRNFLVTKSTVLLAAALLAISTAGASAQARKHHQAPAYGAGINVPESATAGERSSTNVQDAVGPAGYAAPHEVPENGGAASIVQPGSTPNWR